MSLWDTDKNSDSRENPSLNANDGLLQRLANATTSIHPVTDSTSSNAYTQAKNGRLLVNDGTTNRVIVGALPDGTFGMKVSQSAIDVTTATNSQLIFNSGQNMFKIVTKATTSIPSFGIGGSGTNVSLLTIAHGLSTIPIANVFVSGAMVGGVSGTLIASSYIPAPVYSSTLGDPLFPNTAGSPSYYPLHINFAVDATNIYIQATYAGASTDTIKAIPVTYFLLQETAT